MTYAPELADGIRLSGPGKFSLIVDEEVYDHGNLFGFDEGTGSVPDFGEWYGLMLGPITDPKMDLNPLERKLLSESAAFIVNENDHGFVYVTYYESEDEAMQDWNELVEMYRELWDSQQGLS